MGLLSSGPRYRDSVYIRSLPLLDMFIKSAFSEVCRATQLSDLINLCPQTSRHDHEDLQSGVYSLSRRPLLRILEQ